jgi:purine-nucleoside phosphorylase
VSLSIDVIFVPQGAEYKAVCRGLASSNSPPKVIAIPMGITPVTNYLKNYAFTDKRILLMGLAGSLSPQHQIGDVVIYQSCVYIANNSQLLIKNCDVKLTQLLQQNLNAKLVKGLTSDRLISDAKEKPKLAKIYDVNVVDMEGIAILNKFNSVAILRVISDNYNDNLPNLNSAINEEGKLDELKMAIAFLKQPFAAIKLIKSSLKALKNLTKIAKNLNL